MRHFHKSINNGTTKGAKKDMRLHAVPHTLQKKKKLGNPEELSQVPYHPKCTECLQKLRQIITVLRTGQNPPFLGVGKEDTHINKEEKTWRRKKSTSVLTFFIRNTQAWPF